MIKNKETSNFVMYVEHCEPKIKTFETGTDLEHFVNDFLFDNQGNSDNYINLVYSYGTIKNCDLICEKENKSQVDDISYDDIPF